MFCPRFNLCLINCVFFRWFYTSDTVVHEVTLDEVLHSIAYMLFYEKITINEKKPPTRVPQI